jgi:hypothetical protein
MKNLKPILAAFLFGAISFSNAQSTEPVFSKIPKPTLSLSFANTIPSSNTKDVFLTNSFGIALDYSMPLTKRGWGPNGNYISLNFGGQFNSGGSGNPSVALPEEFAIAGQTSSIIAYKTLDSRNSGFKIGVGPQVNFNLSDKFTISSMLVGEYFSVTQKELSAVQTTEYNDQTLKYNLFTLPETKTTGFAVTPKIRVQYRLTKSFGIFADACYVLGPKIKTQLNTLVPIGKPNQQGQYEQQQLNMATIEKGETKSTSYSSFGFNLGFSFKFGENKGPNGTTKSTNANINRSRCNIKQQITINNAGSNTGNEATKMTDGDIDKWKGNDKKKTKK